MSGTPPSPPRSPFSRFGIAATVAVLIVTAVGFAWIAKLSYDLLHGGRNEISKLEPVKVTGPEEKVFDWTTDACAPGDIPDTPAHAFRDAQGNVHLIASADTTRQAVGPNLGAVQHRCQVVMRSAHDKSPGRYAYKEWIFGPYTTDGRTVYALVHDEFHGNEIFGLCPSGIFDKCWYNAVTLARSDDSGQTFRHARTPPEHLVAAIPYPYAPDVGPAGIFQPSNIVEKDGWFYALVATRRYRLQKEGACLIRTRRIDDPTSWRAWDGGGFDTEFVNPYLVRADPGDHVCEPVSPTEIVGMTNSITYNTYFGKYLLIGSGELFIDKERRNVKGFFYSLSDDLIHWSPRKLIKETELPQSYSCGDADPVLYPSLLDPESKSRNFDTSGKHAYIYFTRFHYKGCTQTLDRDLLRVPVEFSK
jgi:hypothetical protein